MIGSESNCLCDENRSIDSMIGCGCDRCKDEWERLRLEQERFYAVFKEALRLVAVSEGL